MAERCIREIGIPGAGRRKKDRPQSDQQNAQRCTIRQRLAARYWKCLSCCGSSGSRRSYTSSDTIHGDVEPPNGASPLDQDDDGTNTESYGLDHGRARCLGRQSRESA